MHSSRRDSVKTALKHCIRYSFANARPGKEPLARCGLEPGKAGPPRRLCGPAGVRGRSAVFQSGGASCLNRANMKSRRGHIGCGSRQAARKTGMPSSGASPSSNCATMTRPHRSARPIRCDAPAAASAAYRSFKWRKKTIWKADRTWAASMAAKAGMPTPENRSSAQQGHRSRREGTGAAGRQGARATCQPKRPGRRSARGPETAIARSSVSSADAARVTRFFIPLRLSTTSRMHSKPSPPACCQRPTRA